MGKKSRNKGKQAKAAQKELDRKLSPEDRASLKEYAIYNDKFKVRYPLPQCRHGLSSSIDSDACKEREQALRVFVGRAVQRGPTTRSDGTGSVQVDSYIEFSSDFESICDKELVEIATVKAVDLLLEYRSYLGARSLIMLRVVLEAVLESGSTSDLKQRANDFLVPWNKTYQSIESKLDVIRFLTTQVPCDCLKSLEKEMKQEPDLGFCFQCGEKAEKSNLFVCKCQTPYCSRECQRADWPTHQKECKALRKAMDA